MKKKNLFSAVALIFFFSFTYSQNLVSNPSFEVYDICPNSWDQVRYAIGWDGVRSSPDYFNTCSSTNSISPPNTGFGNQQPHSGNAFVGLSTFDKYLSDYREIISNNLVSDLQVGTKYFFSFYINMGGVYTLGSDKIGLLFSTTPYTILSPPPINNFAHCYSNSIITDTTNWIKLCGSFVPDSTYQYMMIGNFFNDINTDTMGIGPGSLNINSYYFIDDVCLSTDSLYVDSWTSLQTLEQDDGIRIFPNPCSQLLHIKAIESMKEVFLLNGIGELISSTNAHNEYSIALPVENIPTGTYFLMIKFSNSSSNSIVNIIH